MAITWMDGFDLYGTVNQLPRKGYTGGIQFTFGTGRFGGGRSLSVDLNNNPMGFAVPATNTITVGCAFNISTTLLSAFSTGYRLFTFMSGGIAGTIQGSLGIDANGALIYGRGDLIANKITNSANALIFNSIWNYLEVEITRNAAGGSIFVYMNGGLLFSATGVNTGSAAIDYVRFTQAGGGVNGSFLYDDLYVTNTAARLGECRVEVLRPTADTATKDFTPSTGVTNFPNVDDVTIDDDVTYNSSLTLGHKDLFDLANITSLPLSIKAVQTVLTVRKDNTDLRTVRTNMKNGVTTTPGTTRTLGTSYVMYGDIYELNPDDGAAFAEADINAMQLGYEIVT